MAIGDHGNADTNSQLLLLGNVVLSLSIRVFSVTDVLGRDDNSANGGE